MCNTIEIPNIFSLAATPEKCQQIASKQAVRPAEVFKFGLGIMAQWLQKAGINLEEYYQDDIDDLNQSWDSSKTPLNMIVNPELRRGISLDLSKEVRLGIDEIGYSMDMYYQEPEGRVEFKTLERLSTICRLNLDDGRRRYNSRLSCVSWLGLTGNKMLLPRAIESEDARLEYKVKPDALAEIVRNTWEAYQETTDQMIQKSRDEQYAMRFC